MYVRSIQVRHGDRRVHTGALGPFPCALGVVGFVPVRSVHSRAPCGSSGSFGYVRSIPVRPRVRPGAFRAFPHVLVVAGVVWVRLVHSSAPWGSFGCVRSIPVSPGDRSVRSVRFRVPWGSFGFVWSIHLRLGLLGFVLEHSVHSRAPWG